MKLVKIIKEEPNEGQRLAFDNKVGKGLFNKFEFLRADKISDSKCLAVVTLTKFESLRNEPIIAK